MTRWFRAIADRAWTAPAAPRWLGALLLLAVVELVSAARTGAQAPCVADCDRNGSVAINELVTAVGIALGQIPVDTCPPADANSDERVTIEELLAAVGGALGECAGESTPTPTPGDTILITGGCRRPGQRGLEPCDLDTLVVAWRCAGIANCIESIPARIRLGDGGVQANGNFAFPVDRAAADRVPLLLEASITIATLFRSMDLGGGGAGSASGSAAGAVGERQFDIDPSSEAAVRLLDQEGLELFTPEGVRDLLAAVAAANADTDFAGLDPEEAADLARAVAIADPAVQQVLASARRTATPTVTVANVPTATPTMPASPTAPSNPTATTSATPSLSPTSTSTASPAATPSQTASPAATPRPTASQVPTSTSTATMPATATGTPLVTSTPTRSGTPTRTGTRTSTFTRTASVTPTPTISRTATPSRTPTRTPSPTGTATASRTATPTRTATLTRSPTNTPTPFLAAQLTTNRGCIETGNNPVFAVGEQATLLFRVDGFSAGMPIAEAQVEIFDFVNGAPLGSIDLGTQPTGVTLGFQVGIAPPTGTETLILMAEGGQGPLTDQAQCSFQVVSPECTTACDCPPEQRCVGGVCQIAGAALYCCTSMVCPMGEQCQFPAGGFSTCM